MSLRLTSGTATATLLPERGGLLHTLTLKGPDGTAPILWSSKDFQPLGSDWPMAGAPLLFPFAGRVFHAGSPFRYKLGATVRDMPLHGFAYSLPWRIVAQDLGSATLVLEPGAKTRELFPYDFLLTATYALQPSLLTLKLEVDHIRPLGQVPPAMPLALGWHPFLRVPLGKSSAREDCQLKTAATLRFPVTPLGLAGAPETLSEDLDRPRQGSACLNLGDPNMQSVILGGLGATKTTIVDKKAGASVSISWSDDSRINYLVLWTQPGAPFHCVEPWMALPDAVQNGSGLVGLDPGERMAVTFTIEMP